MADNVPITAGTGTTIATDDVSGVQYQRVKLTDGTPDSTDYVTGTSTRGLKVQTGQIKRISVTPTNSTSAYAAGDAVGGLITFANAALVSGLGCTLKAVMLIDTERKFAPMELVLVDRTFGAAADNAPFDITNADLSNCVAVVPLPNYTNYVTQSVALAQCDIPLSLNGTSLFAQLVTRGTPTFAGTTSLRVIVSILQE